MYNHIFQVLSATFCAAKKRFCFLRFLRTGATQGNALSYARNSMIQSVGYYRVAVWLYFPIPSFTFLLGFGIVPSVNVLFSASQCIVYCPNVLSAVLVSFCGSARFGLSRHIRLDPAFLRSYRHDATSFARNKTA